MSNMTYRRCGRSGLLLPALSLGLWHNFGAMSDHGLKRALCRKAWDLGFTHFDLANNYGPPPGSAEEAFGHILREDFANHRDQMIISSKAGYHMWDGPYGEWGSRKYMIASLDQSLKRMGIAYVDIFYSHRFDPDTPLEETMGALDFAVRSGRALYVGISNYPAEQIKKAAAILKSLGTPCLIHQPRYNMLQREPEIEGAFEAADGAGLGTIVFSPLAQGLLTNKYLGGIPQGSRATANHFLKESSIDGAKIAKLKRLNKIAVERGQTLAQMAIAWVLRDKWITSALIGASRPEQITDCIGAISKINFSAEELRQIEVELSAPN
jgi:L-glyceraldehyde 3-phosphate reductase